MLLCAMQVALKKAVAHQPVAVAIEADQPAFQVGRVEVSAWPARCCDVHAGLSRQVHVAAGQPDLWSCCQSSEGRSALAQAHQQSKVWSTQPLVVGAFARVM